MGLRVGGTGDNGLFLVGETTGLRRRVLELLGFPVVTASDEDADDESLLLANLTNQALAELYTPQDASEEGLRIK